MKEKLQQLIAELNKNLVGKEEVIKLSLLTMLAGENLILFGKPGTAKSEIARRLSKSIEGDSYFEYLLTKFTTPEEIFGPLSIKELKEDRFKRNIEGYMPAVKITFLDEIFKANSSILNSLLTIINEKVYHNGKKKENVPLQSLISASNELPLGDTELNALYDRFLVRKVVDYIKDDEISELFNILDEEFEISEGIKISSEKINEIRKESKKILISKEIEEVIIDIRKEFKETFKNDNNEEFSDRKFVKVLKFLKVSAYTNGRDKVDLSDLLLLVNCLWNNDKNIVKVSKIIKDILKSLVVVGINSEEEKVTNKKVFRNNKFDFKGEGTENNPFLIETTADLIHINSEDYRNKGYYFEQTNDIDLSDITKWDSIGENEEKYYFGHYDGGNYKIINLKGDSGLFGVVDKESSIINIGLEDLDINTNKKVIGGLVNENKSGNIKNCYVIGKLISSGNQVGGLIGHNDNGNIEECYSKVSIEECYSKENIFEHLKIGGLIGYNGNGNIRKCYSIIRKGVSLNCIYSYNDFTISLGGLIGYNISGKVSEAYSIGVLVCTISSIFSYESKKDFPSVAYVGGLIGFNETNGKIDSCYAFVNINGSSNTKLSGIGMLKSFVGNSLSYAGGLIGCNKGNLNNCYYSGENIYISAKNAYAGGLSGSNVGVINNSVVIKKDLNIYGNLVNRLTGNIENKNIINNCFAEQNILINGSVTYSSNPNGADGKSTIESLLNETFYKRLGWDFVSIWTWDNKEKRPIINIISDKVKNSSITKIGNDIDIFKENIWL